MQINRNQDNSKLKKKTKNKTQFETAKTSCHR